MYEFIIYLFAIFGMYSAFEILLIAIYEKYYKGVE